MTGSVDSNSQDRVLCVFAKMEQHRKNLSRNYHRSLTDVEKATQKLLWAAQDRIGFSL